MSLSTSSPTTGYRSRIQGTGSFLPKNTLTNADLEKMVETNDEWIRERTGIESRHRASEDEATSDLAYAASVNALAAAGLAPTDVDAILFATVTPDHSLPNTACLLQTRLGCRPVMALDLSAACSGFVYALSIADHFVRAGTYRNVLVVGAETLSRIVDYTDRGTCILFGDGAGAVILGRAEANEDSVILGSSLSADGHGGKFLQVPTGGSRKPLTAENIGEREHFVKMEGREIFKNAVITLRNCSREAISQSALAVGDIDWFLIHQANLRIIETLGRQLELPEAKVLSNIQTVGNTSSASIPILLDQAVRAGTIQRGQNLCLSAFGAGLTAGSVVLKY